MSPDWDAIAEAISPEQLAQVLGAEKVARGWRCPLRRNHKHGDRDPSFSIFRDGNRTAAKCHKPACGLAGSPVTVAAAVWGVELPEAARRLAEGIGLATNGGGTRGEIVATYDYTDIEGTLLFQVVRFLPKDFRQRRPDGVGGWVWNMKGVSRVLYRLAAIQQAIAAGKRVFVVEGEKDVAAVEGAGYPATCNPGGAGKWRPEYSEALRGAHVVVVADRDEPGRAHARGVVRSLEGVAKRVVLVEPAEGKDVSDHLAAGRKLAELVPVAVDVPEAGSVSGTLHHETTAIRNAKLRAAAIETLVAPQQVASWGWRDVERLLGPLVAGWLIALGARVGNAKTTLLLNLLSRLREDLVPALFFGTEMAPDDLLKKWAAMRCGLDELRVFAGQLEDAERQRMEAEIAYLTDWNGITFSTTGRLDITRLAAEVRHAFDARTGPAPGALFLDHIHRVSQDREELEALAKELKEIAKERRVVMVVAAQLNREQGIGPFDLYSPPSLGRFKGSAAIEEEADVAVGLYRPLRPGMTVAERRAVHQGERAVTDFAEPNALALVCLKHRFRGLAVGRSVWLTINGSRIESRAFLSTVDPPVGAGDAWEPPEVAP